MADSATTHNILILARFADAREEHIQRIAPHLKVVRKTVHDGSVITDEEWRDVEILYTFAHFLPRPEQAPHLRWVQLYSAGANGVLDQPLYQTDVRFTTASGIHAVTIAEYVLTVTLAWYHRLPTLFAWQRERHWPRESGRVLGREEVHGKTIGIVGYGSIGRQVARLASGVGMRVLAMQRGHDHRDSGFILPGTGDPDGTIPERYYAPEEFHALLHASDIVVIAVPLTPETTHLFDAHAFRAMKSSAFLINIARGDVCDEAALLHALQTREIAGAALDVFHEEPLPSDSLFWQVPNLILSPHVTGMHAQYDEHATLLFEENLRRYLAGQPLYNEVDKTRGY